MSGLFVPTLVALLATMAVAGVARRLRPAVAAWLIGTALSSVFVTVLASSWVVSLSVLVHEPSTSGVFAWCRTAVGVHGGVPRWIGLPAMALAVWSTVKAVGVARLWRSHRGERRGFVHIVPADAPVAFSQTGKHGGVVVTTGMLGVLVPQERAALLAHERAHLRHRHDRFLVIGSLVDGVPLFRSAVPALRHALERWADEEAATSVGDRATVASAVARAALARHDLGSDGAPLVLSITGANVPWRVEALLAPPIGGPMLWCSSGLGAFGALSVVGAAAVQVHHLAAAFAHLCPA